MANVLFKRGNTATIDSTAITDGQLLYNTTTGQHYIDSDLTRKEVGKPVVNTTAEVSAITVDNISCGTKPVKELISNLDLKVDGTWYASGTIEVTFNNGIGEHNLPSNKIAATTSYLLAQATTSPSIAIMATVDANSNVITLNARDTSGLYNGNLYLRLFGVIKYAP